MGVRERVNSYVLEWQKGKGRKKKLSCFILCKGGVLIAFVFLYKRNSLVISHAVFALTLLAACTVA